MRLYISASDVTIGNMPAQEDENDIERAIYHLNRVLNNIETKYHLACAGLCLPHFTP